MMDGNSSEKEGCGWWGPVIMLLRVLDCAPGETTELNQWKCLELGMTDEEVWVPFERIMEISPHRLWLWGQQVNLGQLMASAIQRLQCFSSCTGLCSTQSCRQLLSCGHILHIATNHLPSAKDEWETHFASHICNTVFCLLFTQALVYVFCLLPSELWCRKYLA